mgnify:CR=1 FL=1
MAKSNKIPHFTLIPKIKRRWLGQAKGLLQINYEPGLVDGVTFKEKELYQHYSIGGKKNIQGKEIPGTNLVELLKSCSDFKNEMTMLQYVGKKCGIKFMMSPKCHCKIAGECIEIVWGIRKVRFRRIPLEDRKTLETFKAHVKSTFSRDNIGAKESRGAFRTFRSYLLAYYTIHRDQFEREKETEDARDADDRVAASGRCRTTSCL